MNKDAMRLWIEEESKVQYVRSSGPGGQNVNKRNTKVVLLLTVGTMPLKEEEKDRVRDKLSGRLNSEDELVLHASESRSQLMNRSMAEERALGLIEAALFVQKKRRKTRPSRSSQQKRLDSKKQRSQLKKTRNSFD